VKLFMRDSQAIIETIKAETVIIDQYIREDLSSLKPEVDGLLYRVLEYGLLSGGKRIRPLLLVLSARMCENRREDVYRLGCAFEYLHAATLFHDDIIDNSDFRRGKESVFKKFGTVAAILAGDFLHALAMEIVGKFCGDRGLAVFCGATKGMVDGEFLQLRNADRHNISELDYHSTIMGKTGLLIAAACEIGAIYGGGNNSEIKALREYGVNLGCAFQIVDDLLDYLGDAQTTGKVVGNDFSEGKMTLPLILAIRGAGEKDRDQMVALLESGGMGDGSFKEICGLITKYGGFKKAGSRASDAVEKGCAALMIFKNKDIAPERQILEELARYIIIRKK